VVNLLEISQILEQKNKFWIAFVGDSITSTEWVHPNWREIVEYVLKEELTKVLNGNWKLPSWGIRCFNFGFDGSTTKDILEKVNDIKLVNPDLVIAMIGGNDPVLNISVEDHVDNILRIKNGLDTNFVFSTDNKPWNEAAALKYHPFIQADKQMKLDKFINMFDISDSFPKEKIYTFVSEENIVENIKAGDLDYWHPNQLGNAYIAKVMLKKVFSIEFDPEKYWQSTQSGEKYPSY